MKNIKTILFIFVIVLFISYLTKKMIIKTDTEEIKEIKKIFTPLDAENAIKEIKNIYGSDMAKTVEKMMRLETSHFTSGQYKATGSAGMEEGKWKDLPPHKVATFTDNHDGHIGKFIVWNSVTDFAKYLADYINRYNGNFARWNSTDLTKQISYKNKINSISTHFV